MRIEFRQRALLLALVVSLGACTLPPVAPAGKAEVSGVVDTRWPADVADLVPGAEKVGAGGTGQNRPAVLPPLSEDNWRAFFADPPLQRAVERALAANRDLAVAVARLAEVRAQAVLTGAERLPSLDLVGQRSATHTPASVDGNAVTKSRFDLQLGTSWEIDFWGRTASLEAAARAQFLASEFAHAAFRLALIADVANAWYGLEDAQLRVFALDALLSGREAVLAAVKRRESVGLANTLELLAAQASVETAQAELNGAQRARANAENALRALIGGDLTAAILPPAPHAAATAPLHDFPAVAIGLPAEAILRRPDVRAAEARLAVANANIEAARAAFLPRIALTASGGLASHDLDGLFGGGAGAWSFVPSLRLPLFDRERLDASYDLAQARGNAAVADYERSIQQAFREIADGLATARYGRRQAEAAHAAAATQARRLTQVEARYRAGLANYLELLDAQRDSLNALLAQSSARRQVLAAGTAVFKAIGGI